MRTTTIVAAVVAAALTANPAFAKPKKVNIANTPNVRVTKLPDVNVANTPGVNVVNTPGVNVENVPDVNVVNTPGVNVQNVPDVNVANTPGVFVENVTDVNVLNDDRTAIVFTDLWLLGTTTAQLVFQVPFGEKYVITDALFSGEGFVSGTPESVFSSLTRSGGPPLFHAFLTPERKTISFHLQTGLEFSQGSTALWTAAPVAASGSVTLTVIGYSVAQ